MSIRGCGRTGLRALVVLGVTLAACTSSGDGENAGNLAVPGGAPTTVPPSAPTTAPPTPPSGPDTTLPSAPPATAASTAPPTSPPPTEPADSTTLPLPSTTEAPPGPFYRAGDEGPEVAVLQLKLETAGFLEPGYTTGVFDAATNSAVLEFQGQYGLIVDGVVGPETERALTAAALSVNPEPG